MLTFSFNEKSFKILGCKAWYIHRLAPQDFPGKPFEQICKSWRNALSGVGEWNGHCLSIGFYPTCSFINKKNELFLYLKNRIFVGLIHTDVTGITTEVMKLIHSPPTASFTEWSVNTNAYIILKTQRAQNNNNHHCNLLSDIQISATAALLWGCNALFMRSVDEKRFDQPETRTHLTRDKVFNLK